MVQDEFERACADQTEVKAVLTTVVLKWQQQPKLRQCHINQLVIEWRGARQLSGFAGKGGMALQYEEEMMSIKPLSLSPRKYFQHFLTVTRHC